MEISIGSRKIGDQHPVFIVAEISGNHNQSFDRAKKIIDAAIESGADAVKLQTYTADTMTIDSGQDIFKVKGNKSWKNQSLYQLYQTAATPWDWQPKLKAYAEGKGIPLFSTPFDESSVDFLEKMQVTCYKVASFEVVDIPLLEKIGQTKKPVILSRGMSTLEELLLAVNTLKANGCPELAILHCISAYPAKPEEMNLATIPDLRDRFQTVVGLSDHSLDNISAIAAVTLGAKIVEKHLTLSRSDGGPDAAFSLEPEEFRNLSDSLRTAEAAIGKSFYGASTQEKESIIYRRSLFVVADMKEGEKFTPNNVKSIRPGYGLAPKYYREILGAAAANDIARGTPLSWDLVSAKEK